MPFGEIFEAGCGLNPQSLFEKLRGRCFRGKGCMRGARKAENETTMLLAGDDEKQHLIFERQTRCRRHPSL
jgi:hypothetical protein